MAMENSPERGYTPPVDTRRRGANWKAYYAMRVHKRKQGREEEGEWETVTNSEFWRPQAEEYV